MSFYWRRVFSKAISKWIFISITFWFACFFVSFVCSLVRPHRCAKVSLFSQWHILKLLLCVCACVSVCVPPISNSLPFISPFLFRNAIARDWCECDLFEYIYTVNICSLGFRFFFFLCGGGWRVETDERRKKKMFVIKLSFRKILPLLVLLFFFIEQPLRLNDVKATS